MLGIPLLAGIAVYVVASLGILFVYLPMALRRFYAQPRRWTAITTIAVLLVYFRLAAPAVDLSIVVAIWGV